MAGGAGTGGAADTAGTAADGTVIIDSELGHGARRPSPQRARGAFVRQRGFNTASVFCFKPIFEGLFLRRFLVVGLCLPLGSGHAAELKLAADLSRLPALVSRTSLSRSWMRLLVFLQHLDELLNSVRASIGFLGGLNSEEDGSFVCLEYKT
jgi:hypothetical protein